VRSTGFSPGNYTAKNPHFRSEYFLKLVQLSYFWSKASDCAIPKDESVSAVKKVLLLPGDGIGPEIVESATQVLRAVASKHDVTIELVDGLIGGAAIDARNDPFPEETQAVCNSMDAILLGAVGGPKWDGNSEALRPEQGLLKIRKALDLFANLRPVKPYEALSHLSSLRADRLKGVDILFVRELTSGIYFGEPRQLEESEASDTMRYSRAEINRVAKVAFTAAKKRRSLVTSIDKANVLATSKLWRSEVTALHDNDYRDICLEHQLVDSAAMRIVQDPVGFDVVLCPNMFGDILSDEASVLSGTLGLLPSASLGSGTLGLYEPIHGSAPDIAGQGVANPLATILSVALMCRHSLNLDNIATDIEDAVGKLLGDKTLLSPDLGGSAKTSEITQAVIAAL